MCVRVIILAVVRSSHIYSLYSSYSGAVHADIFFSAAWPDSRMCLKSFERLG